MVQESDHHTKIFNADHQAFNAMLTKAYHYALLSVPFTVNRMAFSQLQVRINNIVKGKLAEYYVQAFCEKQQIEADFKACETPFYQVDRRDFLLKGFEWDIKNNYLSKAPGEQEFMQLYGLIPDRFNGDQWSKRGVLHHKSEGVRYLFTFMLKEQIIDRQRKPLFSIQLADAHLQALADMCARYGGKTQKMAPFSASVFWQHLHSLHPQKPLIQAHFVSPLYIAGWCGSDHWKQFSILPSGKIAGGLMRTRIQNRALALPHLNLFG